MSRYLPMSFMLVGLYLFISGRLEPLYILDEHRAVSKKTIIQEKVNREDNGRKALPHQR